MKLHHCLVFTVLFLVVAPGWAGNISWPEGDPIVSHLPGQVGGLAGDTEFIGGAGNPTWQLAADDFLNNETATVRHVSWYGFYGGTFGPVEPPPINESMRIRFYEARPSDGLPGNVLYEQTFADVSRNATGEFVIVGIPRPEYVYHVDLATPFVLTATTPYWLEIVQVGDLASHFRWETGIGDLNGIAFLNPQTPDWQSAFTSDMAFQLSTIPEPATLSLFLISLYTCLSLTKRTRRYRT